ncbi:hypothetical protein QFC24_000181 [Naganishia onofrii]|uniref:Uncharacterized protein n=1 Tax=Naganishia onofrii TaxID=1851511 RepID=A0ACC2XW84_9TREE|nr:hypothetical protein QFC24_000181 [Naganishia onofrii]
MVSKPDDNPRNPILDSRAYLPEDVSVAKRTQALGRPLHSTHDSQDEEMPQDDTREHTSAESLLDPNHGITAGNREVSSMLAIKVPIGNRFANMRFGLSLARMNRSKAPGGPSRRAKVTSGRQLSGPTKYATSAPA